MLKAQLAEWILSLLTTREMAAATVGDWLEEVRARGSLWYWASVARTALAYVWRDMAAAPFRLLGLAICALFAGSALSSILDACWGFATITVIRMDGVIRPPGILRPFPVHQWMSGVTGTTLMVVAVQFQFGRWISRHARGRELTTCLFCAAACIVAGIASHNRVGSVLGQPYAFFGWSALIAGAIWFRQRESIAPKVI